MLVFSLRGAAPLRPFGHARAHRQQHRRREPAAAVRPAAAAESHLFRRASQLRIARAAVDRRRGGEPGAEPGHHRDRARLPDATALVVVMFVQDPIMSLVVFVVVPPVVLALRKLVKRIKNVAFTQWQGGAQTLETLQETIQGIRLVKSFTLEDQMRARFDANVAERAGRLQQDGARQPTAPAPIDRNAGRPRDCVPDGLCRAPRHQYRRVARRILLVHDRVPAGV